MRKRASDKLHVTVWSEGLNGGWQPLAVETYPQDINTCIGGFLAKNPDMEVELHTLSEPEHGLTQEVIDRTDVLVYWSHMYHKKFVDEVSERIADAVLEGMGLLLLHSAKGCKPAERLLGVFQKNGKYREIGDFERIWTVNPGHPICAGLPKEYIDVPHDEMYGEPCGIPNPDELLFISWFEGGEVLRSGATWQKGSGKIFYFAPGHEEFPVYYQPEIQQIITNGVRWLAPAGAPPITQAGGLDEKTPLEQVKNPIYPPKFWDKWE